MGEMCRTIHERALLPLVSFVSRLRLAALAVGKDLLYHLREDVLPLLGVGEGPHHLVVHAVLWHA